ncbi:membrane protein YqaA, SNARE-associated domain [Roseivivax halotolerans]|jgi:membrane protein YqaA with SNARE-associated domain|uniref:Membrane protein YqaA, SNARE-associated domain n=1 Tax=Roseivivax halotolerans TaxID=93684 RepID=A0A1I5Z7I8_9RHOB|nr:MULTISPECIES: YqaA family protein [Roseivivax]QFT62859.1 SNARE associated Golgi protein [Roseivivax sp. THAF30]SFQ52414.1 membrane protein YqaA, SNARE-associated domain [Roseivivax halotolerans]
MLRKTYDKTLALAEHPHALWLLAFVAFIESSVFPIPPDVMMIPMILAAPRRAWLIALIATVSSVAGAGLGYVIGAFFYDSIGAPVLEALGKGDSMAAFNAKFNEYGVWAVLFAGLTPFPFKVITIMSGWTAMPIVPFILSAIIARAARFFIVAGLLYAFGDPIRDFIERRLGLVFTLFCVALIGGFMVLRFV